MNYPILSGQDGEWREHGSRVFGVIDVVALGVRLPFAQVVRITSGIKHVQNSDASCCACGRCQLLKQDYRCAHGGPHQKLPTL